MSRTTDGLPPLLIALGHPFRSDDAAGPKVLEAVRERQPGSFEFVHHSGDPSDLIDLWAGRDVLIVDAARLDDDAAAIAISGPFGDGSATDDDVVARLEDGGGAVTSSHALSLAEALELGRVLGRLPDSMTIVAVAGQDFRFGEGLTPRAARGVAEASQWIVGRFRDAG